MARLLRLIPGIGMLLAPVLGGSMIELGEAPMVTDEVPYFTHNCPAELGIGCLCDIVDAPGPGIYNITAIDVTTTTYPCPTPTTFTKPEWDDGCDCNIINTYWWTPASYPATTTVTITPLGSCITVTSTESPSSTLQETSTTLATTTTTSTTPPTSTTLATTTTTSTDPSTSTTLAAPTTTSTDPSTSTTLAAPTTTSTDPSTSTTCTQTSTSTTSSTAAAQPTLTCDRFGYLVQHSVMYRVDLSNGTTTKIPTGLGGETNAVGYNVLDNFIYGCQSAAAGKYNLVRIAASGTTTVIQDLGAVGGNVGDVDTDGYYWLSAGGSQWWKIDLRPGSATYTEIVTNGTADPKGYTIADWVYMPLGGRFLYAVATNGPTKGYTSTLIRFNMDTYVWTAVKQYTGTPSGGWGAAYGINTGVIYASDNPSGQIWMFPINGSDPKLVTHGPASGSNDGARCVLNVGDT
ncbi:hypothetical protein GQ53DRAFT_875846 [Thozetella sp. PMI_491]|nr:hypothetical protein GQ53DRAFT_875846 [Thozetella sp. PMI_491]